MPIYTYSCPYCGKQTDEYRKIADRHNAPECHGLMEFKIMPVSVQGDNTDYRAVAIDKKTGKRPVITSRKQHREFLARNDYVAVG